MARRRDKLAGITGSRIDRETLFGFYDSIYRQGSSVAHYDLYSINMLGLYEGPEGLVLAPDPHMPIVLALHCAIFDIAQYAEALAKADVPAPVKALDGITTEGWRSSGERRCLTIRPSRRRQSPIVVGVESAIVPGLIDRRM